MKPNLNKKGSKKKIGNVLQPSQTDSIQNIQPIIPNTQHNNEMEVHHHTHPGHHKKK